MSKRTGRPNPATYDAVARFLTENPARLEALVARTTPEPNTGCWLWLGALNKNGYANAIIKQIPVVVHRALYAHKHGGDPGAEFDCDHICTQRSCVNPDHVRPVSHRQNVLNGRAKKTHCKRGHELAGANLYPTKRGSRCAKCVVIFAAQRDERRRARARQFGTQREAA